MNKKNIVTKILSALLAAVIIITSVPVTEAYAANKVNRYNVTSLWSGIITAHNNGSRYNGIPSSMYPEGCETIWDKGNIGLGVRNTSIGFITSTVILDISEYPGLAVEAVNSFLADCETNSSWKYTPFSAITRARIDFNVSQSNQPCYLLDTLNSYKALRNRYAGGTSNKNLIGVNVRGETAAMIGCLMDAGDMNGAKGMIYDASYYSNEAHDAHVDLLKTAVGEGYKPRICKFENGSWSIKSFTSDIVDKVSQDSGDSNYIPVTAVEPILVPTFKTRNSGDYWQYKTTLVYNNVLYTNLEYLGIKYFGQQSMAYKAGGYYEFDNDVSRLTDNMNYRWHISDGKGDNVLREMTQLSTGVNSLSNYVKVVRALMEDVLEGETYLHLNDLLILQATTAGLGVYLSDATAIEYDWTDGEYYTVGYGEGFEPMYSDLYGPDALSTITDKWEEFECSVENLSAVYNKFFALYNSSIDPYNRVLGVPITSLYNYSNILAGKTFVAGSTLNSKHTMPLSSLSNGSLNANYNLFKLDNKVFIAGIPAPNAFSENRLFVSSGSHGIATQYDNRMYNASYKINPADREVTYKGSTLVRQGEFGKYVTSGKFLIISASNIPTRIITVKVEKDASGTNNVEIYGPSQLVNTIEIKATGDNKETCYSLLDKIEGATIEKVTGPEKNGETLLFTSPDDARGLFKINFSIPSASIIGDDIEFEVSAKGVELLYDNSPSGDFIETIARPDKEYEEDALPRVEEKGEDKAKVVLGGSKAPVEYHVEIEEGKDPSITKDSEVFELYEGCSYSFYPQLTQLPVPEGSSGVLELYMERRAESELKDKTISISYTNANLDTFNGTLKGQYKDFLEFYDISGEAGKLYEKVDDIEIAFNFKDAGVEFKSTLGINCYKWEESTELKFETPSSNVITANTDVDVKANCSNTLDRNSDDADGTVHTEGQYVTVHNITLEKKPDGGDARLLNDVITTETTGAVSELGEKIFFKLEEPGVKKYSEAALKANYAGILNLDAGEWIITDESVVSMYSVKQSKFVEVITNKATGKLTIEDGAPVTVRFDKEAADYNESVPITFGTIKPSDYGLEKCSNFGLSYDDADNYDIRNLQVQESGSGPDLYYIVKAEITFSEKGKYAVTGLNLYCDEYSFVLQGDPTNTSNPFFEVTVPISTRLHPFDIIVEPEREEMKLTLGDSSSLTYTATLSKGPDYDEWVKRLDPSGTATLSFTFENTSKNGTDSGMSYTSNFKMSKAGASFAGTNKDLNNSLGSSINFTTKFNPTSGATSAKHTLKVTVLYSYTNDAGNKMEGIESVDTGCYEMLYEPEAPERNLAYWIVDARAEFPDAYVSATLPDPSRWRWDVMNAIPSTETVSATVGADIYNGYASGVVITRGMPMSEQADHKDNVNDPDDSGKAALTRKIIFRVKVTDIWGAETSETCDLSCSGHSVTHSCPATSTSSCGGKTQVPCSHCGWQVDVPGCNENSSCSHEKGTCDCNTTCGSSCGGECQDHEEGEPEPDMCDHCAGTCVCVVKSCPVANGGECCNTYCPDGTHHCDGTSASEACPTGAETSLTITWNCGSNDTNVEASGSVSGDISAGELNDHNQAYTGFDWSWECSHCDGSAQGTYEFNTLIDHGYTTPGSYGHTCAGNHNNAAHRHESGIYEYTLVQTVDAITYAKMLHLNMQGLAGAKITDAIGIYEKYTAGRTVLSGDIMGFAWRAQDDFVLTDPMNTEPGSGMPLLETGRIRYTGFPNPALGEFGIKSSIDTEFYCQADEVIVNITVEASKDVLETMGTDYKNQIYSGYKYLNGIEDSNYGSYTKDDFLTAHKGDYLTDAEIKALTIHAVNHWLYRNNEEKEYTCNVIGDAASYEGACLAAGYWATEAIPLCNVSFTDSRTTTYRAHRAGVNNPDALAAMGVGSVCTDFNGGNTRTGYSGNYNPNGDMFTSAPADYSIGNAVARLIYGGEPAGTLSTSSKTNGSNAVFDVEVYWQNTYGELEVSSAGSSISVRDEYFGKAPKDVDNSASVVSREGENVNPDNFGNVTAATGGGGEAVLEGEFLVPQDTEGVYLTDGQTLSFLGIQLEPSSKNGKYLNSMTIKTQYKTLLSYTADAPVYPEDYKGPKVDVTDDTDMTSEYTCSFNEYTINPVVIVNPIGVSTFLYDNTYGANNDIYSVDESKEDFRDEVGGTHIVIGNTFNVWVSQFITEDSESAEFNEAPVEVSWSTGTVTDPETGKPEDGAGGTGMFLYTNPWARKLSMQFDFPVSYKRADGTTEYIDAGEVFPVWEKVYEEGSSGKYEFVEYVTPKYSGKPLTADVETMGDLYEFTCCLSADESLSSSYTVYLESINPDGKADMYADNNTSTNRTDIVAADEVFAQGSSPIIGRIGDIAITDTQDYRFSNTFWETGDSWLIPDIVKETTDVSKTTLRTSINMINKTGVPVFGSINNSDTVNTGLTMSSVGLPLSSAIQDLPEFKDTNLGLGYNAYISISTVGEYTGKLGSSMYPTSILDESVDTRTNKLFVWPKYALYDLDENKFYDIELWAGTSTSYDLFWSIEDWTPNYANEVSLSMDEDLERMRYCVSDFAKYYSILFNDNTYSAFTDYVYQGNANSIVLDERSNIVIGVREDEAIPKSFDKATSKYVWDNNGNEYIVNPSSTTSGKQSTADYAVNARRWFFSLGLPSSTIVTYPNPANNALAIKSNNEKLLKEHPNSVVCCFADIYAQGDVWNLQYDFGRYNGTTTIDICENSVDFANAPVYINDDVSYTLKSSWVPLFVTDVKRTSTQDLTQQGTH